MGMGEGMGRDGKGMRDGGVTCTPLMPCFRMFCVVLNAFRRIATSSTSGTSSPS